MKKRFVSAFAVIMVITLLLCGCGRQEMNDDASSVASMWVSSVEGRKWKAVNGKTLVIKVGEADWISIITAPKTDYIGEMNVEWELSEEMIVGFVTDPKGYINCKIIGLKPGEVTITGRVTAPDGDGTVSCKVIVEE